MYTGAVPNQQGDIFIPWLAENVGKKFFLLGTDTVYAQLINSQCREALAEVGGEVVGEEYVPNGHNDFSTIITKIKEADPDVLFVNLNGDSGVAFFKQYKQYGLDPATMPVASYLLDESTVAALGAETAAGHYTSIGGRGNLTGAMLGTLIVNWLQTLLSEFSADIWPLVLGGMILAVIFVIPTGIVGKLKELQYNANARKTLHAILQKEELPNE